MEEGQGTRYTDQKGRLPKLYARKKKKDVLAEGERESKKVIN